MKGLLSLVELLFTVLADKAIIVWLIFLLVTGKWLQLVINLLTLLIVGLITVDVMLKLEGVTIPDDNVSDALNKWFFG